MRCNFEVCWICWNIQSIHGPVRGNYIFPVVDVDVVHPFTGGRCRCQACVVVSRKKTLCVYTAMLSPDTPLVVSRETWFVGAIMFFSKIARELQFPILPWHAVYPQEMCHTLCRCITVREDEGFHVDPRTAPYRGIKALTAVELVSMFVPYIVFLVCVCVCVFGSR